jgi:type IV pilus assembly protein PilY1
MHTNSKVTGQVFALTVTMITVCWALSVQCVFAASYSPCRVPPQIASSAAPNVLLVMDFSGSMQLSAYYDSECSTSYANSRVLDAYNCGTAVTATYLPATSYYGLFESDLYYLYDHDKGWFTPKSEPTDGSGASATNQGNWSIGVRGNVLNWALTSRMDSAMKALIGGKAYGENDTDCDDDPSGETCYVKAEGARRYVIESTNANAEFYIRPVSNWSASLVTDSETFPDEYSSSSYLYPTRDLVVSVKGIYTGALDTTDTVLDSRYYELWQFTVTRDTHVAITLTPSFGSNQQGRLQVSTTSSSSGTYTSTDGNPASFSAKRTAGTYYVRVTSATANTTKNKITGTYSLKTNVQLTPVTGYCNNGTVNTVGGIPYARVRVTTTPTLRRGSIQNTWSKARWGFMYYKGDTSGHKGNLLAGCGTVSSATEFVKYIEGKKTTDKEPYPYEGTPSGEALAQAYYYFRQNSTSPGVSNWPSNINTLSAGTASDPYYTSELVDGAYKPVSCRKSYIILMSDGNWYHNAGGVLDPIIPAHLLHMTDLRTDTSFPGTQSVDLFTMFAFNGSGTDDYTYGSRAQKWVAMYGGHRELTGCNTGWPWPQTGYLSSKNSTDTDFSITQCTATTPNGCCKEWDTNMDLITSGDGLGKGIPDNYFEVQTGDQLEAAITGILSKIDQQNASSSAVATVAQQTGDGDIVIRGMFQAKPPETDTTNYGVRFYWFGHLESYWPNTDGYYDYELYSDIMCKDVQAHHSSTYNCWDAAMPSTLSGPWPLPANRNVFTYKNGAKTTFNTTNITASDLGVSTTTERDTIVNWALGTENSSYRARVDTDGNKWILGDVVYSTSVVVSPPSLGAVSDATKAVVNGTEVGIVKENTDATAQGFTQFFLNWRQTDATGRSSSNQCVSSTETQKSIKYRDKFVYVGGNDGMLHAFLLQVYDFKNQKWAKYPADHDSNTCSGDVERIKKIGQEIWAYIPSNFLTELTSLASTSYALESGGCQHRFTVDLAPRGWEVFFDDQATSSSKAPWHTVLIGGQRGGGDMYFALDVTNPWSPDVLWEYSVLQNMAVRFYNDTSHAAKALKSACDAGTVINPGTLSSTCQAPVPHSSWWPSCSSWSLTQCQGKLNDTFGQTEFWTPFDATSYATLKKLPMSWSTPYLGRVKLSTGVEINACPLGSGCTPTCSTDWSTVTGVHNFAFIGGGVRNFDPDLDIFDSFTSTSRDFYKAGFGHLLWEPFLLALDVQTGRNAFRYVWPEVVKQSSAFFPQKETDCIAGVCSKTVPYAMSDPVVLDHWSVSSGSAVADGYEDSIYVADMNGLLYGIKLNLGATASSGAGIYVDLWKAKPIPSNTSTTQDCDSNYYRSCIQPVTVQPALSLESQEGSGGKQYVRLVMGAGKYEDIEGSKNDTTDVAKMSFYNLRELVDFSSLGDSTWTIDGTSVTGGTIPNTSGSLIFRVRANCGSTVYRCTGEGTESGCKWTATDTSTGSGTTYSGCQWYNSTTGSADCCESSCASPCWYCVFDLSESGERVTSKATIAGGVVFFTSFKPVTNDPCSVGGEGYLYAFNYLCQPFSSGFNPIGTTALTVETFPGSSTASISGARVTLGAGVPSQPVLDSTGKYIIVQTSNAEIFRVSVNLQEKMVQIKGWTEKDR